MISKQEVMALAAELQLQAHVVEKDYALGWFLAGISAHPVIGPRWVFKGGTCLKKCYFETYRFSEDLDFTLQDAEHLDEALLAEVFEEIGEWVYDACGLQLPAEARKFEVFTNKRGTRSGQGRVGYRGPLGKQGDPPRIKLDLAADEVLVLPTHSRPRSPVDAACMGLVLSNGPGPVLAPRQIPVRPPFGAFQLNAPLMPEVLLRSDVDGQVALPLACEGVLRYVWESRYGTILIEVAGDDVFVNGQRVERHAHPAMHSAEPSASLGQNSRRENPSSMIRYGKMPYP